METLGFTSSITTESTALAARQPVTPKAPAHTTRARTAAAAIGAQRRLFRGAAKGTTLAV